MKGQVSVRRKLEKFERHSIYSIQMAQVTEVGYQEIVNQEIGVYMAFRVIFLPDL